MIILGTEITCRLYDSYSLKDKRRIIKSIISRGMNKYPVSIAEVGDWEMLNVARIGIAIVSSDYVMAEKVLNKVHRRIEAKYELEIVETTWYEAVEI